MQNFLMRMQRFFIRLYPRPFQEEFGAEMESIFQEQLDEAAAYGRLHMLQIGWRELRDWPLQCFQAHWQLRQQNLALASTAPPSWWDTAVAVLPYFLFAIIVSSSALVFIFGQAAGLILGLAFTYGFIFLLLLVLIFAWWRGWPVWAAAWLGFLSFAVLVLFAPGQLFDILGQPAQMVVSEALFPLLWLAVLYVLLVRWPRAGLVAMLLPIGIGWIFYLEFVPENVSLIITAVTWVWLGIVAMVLLRWRHHAWDIWLLYLAAIVTGALYTYAGQFLTIPQVRDGTLAGMGEDILSVLLPTLIPLVGILLLLTLRQWAQLNGRTAIQSYRFLLIGVILASIGLQTVLMASNRFNFTWPAYLIFLSTAVLITGGLLLILGVRKLFINRNQWMHINGWQFWLLIVLLLLLPLLINTRWFNIVFSTWLAGRLIGLIWLALAAWIIGRLRYQLPPTPVSVQVEPETDETAAVLPANDNNIQPPITKRQKLYFWISFILLGILLLPATTLAVIFPNNQAQPFDVGTSLPLFMTMTLGLVMVAVLLAAGLRFLQAKAWKTAVLFLGMSILLLAASLHNYFWLAVWDSTYDGLGSLWLFLPFTAIFGTTAWLVMTLPRQTKLGAFLYLLLLPPALLLMTEQATHADFNQITEIRAERISQAIEQYHEQNGHYPAGLRQLLNPRYLLSLSEPMIIFGQDWCYVGDFDSYQFGYVYREHWSSPDLTAYVYSASDETATLPPLCRSEITGLHKRDPGYYDLRSQSD